MKNIRGNQLRAFSKLEKIYLIMMLAIFASTHQFLLPLNLNEPFITFLNHLHAGLPNAFVRMTKKYCQNSCILVAHSAIEARTKNFKKSQGLP
jgi:hypothetical protein